MTGSAKCRAAPARNFFPTALRLGETGGDMYNFPRPELPHLTRLDFKKNMEAPSLQKKINRIPNIK